MVIKKQIVITIKKLDSLYNTSPTLEATYYSKLAIIELCGWIELTMDNIVQHFATKHLKTQPFINSFNSLKEKNYGFDYKQNFRKMLSQTVGLHNTEKLERKINRNGDITRLDSTLDTLKLLRNDAAHTFIKTTTTYQSPSVTKAQLELVYPILKEFSKEIKSLK
jgi:hypothetical protein